MFPLESHRSEADSAAGTLAQFCALKQKTITHLAVPAHQAEPDSAPYRAWFFRSGCDRATPGRRSGCAEAWSDHAFALANVGPKRLGYPDPAMMKNRTALLRYFITLEMQEEKKRRDRALAEQTKKVAQGAAASAEMGSQLLALMREGRHAEAKKLAESLEQAQSAGPAAAVNAESAMSSTAGAGSPAMPSSSCTSVRPVAGASSTAAPAMVSTAGTATSAPASTSVTARSTPSLLSSTVADAVARFVERRHPGPDPAPASFYSKKAEQLQRLLGPIRLAELTPAELTLYQRKRRSERVQEGTVKAELKVLRQALGEAAAAGLLELSVLENLLPTSSRAGPRKPGASGGPP